MITTRVKRITIKEFSIVKRKSEKFFALNSMGIALVWLTKEVMSRINVKINAPERPRI